MSDSAIAPGVAARQQVRDPLKNLVIGYARVVVLSEWPEQQAGASPIHGIRVLTRIQQRLGVFEPGSDAQRANYAETLRAFNQVAVLRRMRIQSLSAALQPTMWWVVGIGAALSIALTWMLIIRPFGAHVALTTFMSALIGLLIFQIANLDRPFRGTLSVAPDAFCTFVLDASAKPCRTGRTR